MNGVASPFCAALTIPMQEREGITERLMTGQPILWVGRMNSIRARAEEIVMEEVINAL